MTRRPAWGCRRAPHSAGAPSWGGGHHQPQHDRYPPERPDGGDDDDDCVGRRLPRRHAASGLRQASARVPLWKLVSGVIIIIDPVCRVVGVVVGVLPRLLVLPM